MKTVYIAVAVVFIIVAPIRFVYVLVQDFQHPELWDQDWQRDPRIYLPLICVLALLVCWWWRRERRKLVRVISDIQRRGAAPSQGVRP